MNKNYISGRRFEYSIKKELEKQGWIAIRSAGSHSPFDIIAIKNDKILLLQLKHYKEKLPRTVEEREREKFENLNIEKELKVTYSIITDKKQINELIMKS